MKFFLLIPISLLAVVAEAKVFDFPYAQVATFISGTYGTSALHDAAYGNVGGSGTISDDGATTQGSGEVGVVAGFGDYNLVASAEFFSPHHNADGAIATSGGAQLIAVDSRINAIVASVGIEYLLRRKERSHILLGGALGYADVTMINDYTLTSAGQALYPAADAVYSEHATGFGVSLKAYAGWEYLFTDNVTMCVSAGYRYFRLTSLNYTAAATTVNGSVNNGDAVKDSNGSSRWLDMSGAFAAIGFRFYFL